MDIQYKQQYIVEKLHEGFDIFFETKMCYNLVKSTNVNNSQDHNEQQVSIPKDVMQLQNWENVKYKSHSGQIPLSYKHRVIDLFSSNIGIGSSQIEKDINEEHYREQEVESNVGCILRVWRVECDINRYENHIDDV